jgi:hypothetical protein
MTGEKEGSLLVCIEGQKNEGKIKDESQDDASITYGDNKNSGYK